MKKIFFLLTVILVAACGTKTSCVLAQFPPQIIYANQACQGTLPNYAPRATVVGGCTGFVVTQTPAPGTLLTATNKVISVILKATGSNNKSSQISFTVTLADTITPRITGLTAIQLEDTLTKKSNALYDAGDRFVAELEKLFNKTFPFEEHPGMVPSNDYDQKALITVSMKDSLGTGRARTLTFVDPLDIPRWNTNDPIPQEPAKVNWDDLEQVPLNVIYALNYKDIYDWLAHINYLPIPKRLLPASPDLSSIKITDEFVPLIFDKTSKKFKFWDEGAWHTITSN